MNWNMTCKILVRLFLSSNRTTRNWNQRNGNYTFSIGGTSNRTTRNWNECNCRTFQSDFRHLIAPQGIEIWKNGWQIYWPTHLIAPQGIEILNEVVERCRCFASNRTTRNWNLRNAETQLPWHRHLIAPQGIEIHERIQYSQYQFASNRTTRNWNLPNNSR